MKAKIKENILWVLVLGILAGAYLPRPWNLGIACILLIPCTLYLIAHIIKYGNKW